MIFSQETRRKISIALSGKPKSLSHRQKLSEVRKLKPNKYWLGRRRSMEDREKFRLSHLGKTQTKESRLKRSIATKGEKSVHWKGGVTPINEAVRKSLEYKLWREAVFVRDNYTCQACGVCGVSVQADHIKPFAIYPELRFAIDNGRTLCVPCHKETDTYGNRKK